MKNMFIVSAVLGVVASSGAFALSAGTVGASDAARVVTSTGYTATSSNNGVRGNQALANAYLQNQRNTYYMVTQPDVDTACRQKIYNCLSEYCGDVTVVPGMRTRSCQYATESELYNYALLCLQKDTSILLPQYNVRNGQGGTNTAARLCPSYVQQEVMSYLSMANMAEQLNKSHSDLCIQRRQELEAAMACHSIAIAYSNETASKLNSYLTDYCGAGVPGGSAEMVTRFANAGNVGANVWGWAEKIISLDLSNKGDDWKIAVDNVLVNYTNRMNLACGDNMQLNLVSGSSSGSGQPSALQTAAAVAIGLAFPTAPAANIEDPFESQSLAFEVQSRALVDTYATAEQIVRAAMSNSSLTANDWFTSAQIDSMKTAYIRGTKAFVLRDSSRCYIVPVQTMTDKETSMVAQLYGGCVSR